MFEEGYIESIHLEQFYSFIEQEFNFKIEEELFFDERFSTIKGIAGIILEQKEEEQK